MGPLGVPELIFILVLALLIFGPRKLPEIGRTLGRGLSEFRKASNELKRSLNTEIVRDVKDIHDEIRDHHPRRMLAKAIEEPPAGEPATGEPTTSEEPESDKSDATAPAPDGTVARSAAAAEESDPTPGEEAAAEDPHPGAPP